MTHLDGHVESKKSSPVIRPGGAVEAMAMRIIVKTYARNMRFHAWSSAAPEKVRRNGRGAHHGGGEDGANRSAGDRDRRCAQLRSLVHLYRGSDLRRDLRRDEASPRPGKRPGLLSEGICRRVFISANTGWKMPAKHGYMNVIMYERST